MLNKRKAIKILGYIILFTIIAIVGYNLLYYQEIRSSLEYEIQTYGPIGLLITAFIVDVIAGPIGPEVPIVGGILANIKIPTVISMTAIGSGLATLFTYTVGYFFGEYGVLHYFNEKKFNHWKHFFVRHRHITLVLGALTPVPYVIICILAGIFKVRLSEYILLTIGARFIRIIGAVYAVLLFQKAI